jgi:hypothetical protein
MLTLAFDISYSELESPELKQASFAINEILSNDEAVLAELFFQGEESPSDLTENIGEEL